MRRYGRTILAGLLLLAVLSAIDLLAGGGKIGPASGIILWKLRVPRLLSAAIAGASLSLSGAQMQSIFRNPLAEPHIMGISSGAGFGAAIAIIAFPAAGAAIPLFSKTGIAFAAALGAAAAAMLTFFAASRIKGGASLLIFGVMLGFIFNALSSLLQYMADEESLKLFYSWLSGSFSGNRYDGIVIMASALAAGCALAAANAKGLDIALFGDEYALMAGADIRKIRIAAISGCCLMTGAVTAFCGPVGFIGIIAPHISKRCLGTAVHKAVLPGCMLTGACLCILADIISSAAPVPIPAGSAMALIGIPVIFAILLKKK